MKSKFWLLIFITLLHNISLAAETAIEVIPLFNRPASEIQALLSPLLEESDRVIADGSNLLVKTRPERLAEIIMFIDKLDTPLNNLIITVVQSRHATAEELNVAAGVKSTGTISGHFYQTQDPSSNESTQTIRTMEGKPAHISVGKTYPIQNLQVYNYGYGYPAVSSSTEFIDATTGFAVTPRLVEQQVILDVSPWSDNYNAQGQVETRNAQSTIKVNLGEWVELGGSDQNSHSSSNGTLATIRQTNQNKVRILVKVDKAK